MQDYHMHTKYSPDACDSVEALACRAMELGLTDIAITDHEERGEGRWAIGDKDAYLADIESAKAKYPQLRIARAMELDYNAPYWQELSALVSACALDFALVSLHKLDDIDAGDAAFFASGTKRDNYARYLTALYDMLKTIDGPYVIGHITYVAKFAPFEDKKLEYAAYSDLLDSILKVMAQKGFGMECNTSGYKSTAGPLPDLQCFKRFRELGGELVTIGSDTHGTGFVGFHNADASALLREAGFTHYAAFEALKPRMMPL